MAQLLFSGCCSSWYTQQSSSALVDRNHHLVIVGKQTTEDFNTSAVAVKSTGDLTSWQQAYPGQFRSCFKDVAQLKDGSYLAAGSCLGSASIRDQRAWLVNIGPSGEVIWETKSEPALGYQSGRAVTSTTDGGFVAVSNHSTWDNRVSTRIIKFAHDKTPAWEVCHQGTESFSIRPTLDGGFIISGCKRNRLGISHPVAIVLSGEGEVVLDKTFTGFGSDALTTGEAIQTVAGDFVMVVNNWILKFSVEDALLWSREITNVSFSSVVEVADSQLAMGGTIQVNYNSQAYVVVTDGNGNNLIWDNCELQTPSIITRVFRDSRFQAGLWVSGHAPLERERSQMVFALFTPVKSLSHR